MEKFTAPFNFVPIFDKVYHPCWGKYVSHDVPFEDGEDGVIELTIENKSPIFIGSNNDNNEESCFVQNSKGEKIYYIPSTTLKGCFRSVMEILSFAKLEQYNNTSFGYRNVAEKQSVNKTDYRERFNRLNIRCGWLYKDGDKYKIKECSKGVVPISNQSIINRLKLNVKIIPNDLALDITRKRCSLKKDDTEYIIVCTGHIDKKKNNYLFSKETKDPITIIDNDFYVFDSIHNQTPQYSFNGKDELKKDLKLGKEIPVFFAKEGKAVLIGLTRYFRLPYSNSVKDAIDQKFENKYDLPQCIFGCIDNKNTMGGSLKGRVHISNAFIDTSHKMSLTKINGVLAQPKSSYYPLYLKQTGIPLQNYNSNKISIAGRKRYRISEEFKTLDLPKGNGNANIEKSFCPIPAGNKFNCKIRIHNLRKIEIGALLATITFNQNNNCYHNIGLAKSCGYGIIDCKIDKLDGLKYNIDNYIQSFNEEISFFLKRNNSALSTNEAIKQLFAIASPTHSCEDMKYMELGTYNEYKSTSSYLKENTNNVTINFSNEDELYKRRLENEILTKITDIENKDYSLEEIITELKKLSDTFRMDSEPLKKKIEYYENIYNKEKEEEAKKAKEKEEEEIKKRKEEKRLNGLSFLTEKKANESNLKIDTFANGVGRIKKHMKEFNITDDDIEIIKSWILMLEPSKKADKRDLSEAKSNSWKNLKELLGEEVSKQLHDTLKNRDL